MEQRQKLIDILDTGLISVTEACRLFSVSRKTAYKWIERFAEEGPVGLEERSRAPKYNPRELSVIMRQRLIRLRTERPTWGPRKMLAFLAAREPGLRLPAASTVGDFLKREGLVRPRRRRTFRAATPTGLHKANAPNDCWCVDFKGDFVVENRRCFPLTVTDLYSRFLLGCEALPSTHTDPAMRVFERLFHEYGLPSAIRSDNGTPFASTGLAGLSRLSVWWMRLGIRLERIPPGKPQHNGQHERMHRTLKAETTKPAEATFVAQQRRFDDWREDFNTERPHEALDNAVPAALYTPSQRSMPSKLKEYEYPPHLLLRLVHNQGAIKWKKRHVYVSESLKGQVVGLEELDDKLFALRFLNLELGFFDARGPVGKVLPLP
jgi:transposase InsO family protein